MFLPMYTPSPDSRALPLFDVPFLREFWVLIVWTVQGRCLGGPEVELVGGNTVTCVARAFTHAHHHQTPWAPLLSDVSFLKKTLIVV